MCCHAPLAAAQAIEREGALDKLRTKQFAADKLFLQQVRSSECKGGSNGGRLVALWTRRHRQLSDAVHHVLACFARFLRTAAGQEVLHLADRPHKHTPLPAAPQVIPAMCAGKVMGPGGEAIKALSERCGCRCGLRHGHGCRVRVCGCRLGAPGCSSWGCLPLAASCPLPSLTWHLP